MKGARLLLLLLVVSGCTSGSDAPEFDNPLDPITDPGIPSPEAIVLLVGNNTVRLSWSLPEGESATEFAIYRRKIDEAGIEIEGLRQVGTTQTTAFQDSQVRNGQIYLFSVTAGDGIAFGRPSEEIEARPAAFGLVLESGAEATRDKDLSVTFNIPNGTTSVQLSEGEDFPGVSWRPVASVSSWSASAGDGVKTVYARFQIDGGAESLPISDSIRLDTQAVIRLVDFDGSDTRAPGQPIRFRVDAGEPGGAVQVNVPGLFSSLVLFDDGTDGDVANNGIYEREVAIPDGAAVNQATVTATFTDALGNQAAQLAGARRLTVEAPPVAVELLDPEVARPPNAPSVSLRWTASTDAAFSAYRVHRSDGGVDQILTTILDKQNTAYVDPAVTEGTTYSYTVEVVSTAGLQANSSPILVDVPNLRPPAAVTLQSAEASSTTRLALKWGRSSERDFEAYRVYRNATGAVTDQDSLLAEIDDPDLVFFDDEGRRENTAYFYRVYTLDRGGLSSRSNEVEGRTKNEAPPAVTLSAATNVDSTAATLNWTGSTVHDFKFYRVYRSEASGVSTASNLAAEIDNSANNTYRDTGLTKGTTYHYRVYVVDDGTNPEPKSTGSNEIIVTTTSP